MVAPVTENVTAKHKHPDVAVTPVVSTVTAAVLPKGIDHPPPAVAKVPWDENTPVNHAVDDVAAAEIVL